jgi:hypothetical protein
LIAKIANSQRENRQREGAVTWRPRFDFGNIGKIVSRFKSLLGNRNNLRLFFEKNMTILPIALFPSSNQALTSPNHWQFTLFLLPNPLQNHYQYCPYLTICKTMSYTKHSNNQKGIANHENHY